MNTLLTISRRKLSNSKKYFELLGSLSIWQPPPSFCFVCLRICWISKTFSSMVLVVVRFRALSLSKNKLLIWVSAIEVTVWFPLPLSRQTTFNDHSVIHWWLVVHSESVMPVDFLVFCITNQTSAKPVGNVASVVVYYYHIEKFTPSSLMYSTAPIGLYVDNCKCN